MPADVCPKCQKSPDLCLCAEIKPVATRLKVLILQHPQEPDKKLGTARLTHLALIDSKLKVGLSWPNLRKAWGDPNIEPSRWAVLYLGSGIQGANPSPAPLVLVDKKGTPLGEKAPRLEDLEGVVFLDGTWSQAKALWWRNAWLLKLKRAILVPSKPSLYKDLRKEPRRECLSTLESVAETLEACGEPTTTSVELKRLFELLLNRFRESVV